MIIKDPLQLNAIQDKIFSDPAYQPTAAGITFCNLATNSILEALGYSGLHAMTADQMYAFVTTSPDWLIKPLADCQALVNVGTIIIGTLPAVKLGQGHGHVNTLTTGNTIGSGHWNLTGIPMCMNIGRAGTCFRRNGENYAFQIIPEFYALKETL